MSNIERIAVALGLEFEIWDGMKSILEGQGLWRKTGIRLTNDLLDAEMTDKNIEDITETLRKDIEPELCTHLSILSSNIIMLKVIPEPE